VGLRLAELESLASGAAFRVIPNAARTDGPWSPASPVLLEPLASAYKAGDASAFEVAATTFASEVAAMHPDFHPPAWRMNLETLYQQAHPIRWAWILYLGTLLVLALAGRTRGGYVAGWILALAGFGMQVAGFAARVLISGRPPVTNMYESVLWVAFGTVLFALIFEAIYRSRVLLMAACPVAIVSLILADSQPASLDRSIHPLVPVLRDNFWLTTHVLTITLSYAAFALALALGHIILWSVIRGRNFYPALANYLYRVLQVGVLLLAVGTILGGVWANYSWGRFWDWDPKEVWALVTLLAYLFVLHGRIAGKWAGFGMAVGAVLCFLSVLMAWYGVNFVLGVGLHSYGFGSGGFGYALAFVIAESAFVALAVVRRRSARRAAPQVPALG
jgi:ABC-type transport system involved in cytochrome c biogenesis permease subunit